MAGKRLCEMLGLPKEILKIHGWGVLTFAMFRHPKLHRAMQFSVIIFYLDPYLNRGIAKEALQLWEEASKDYKYVLKKNPQDVSALYNLGNVMGSMDNWIEAKKLFAQAVFGLFGRGSDRA